MRGEEPRHSQEVLSIVLEAQETRVGGLDVIRKEAWPFYRTISGVRLCWELEKPKGPNGVEERSHPWRWEKERPY